MKEKDEESRSIWDSPDGRKTSDRKAVTYKGRCDITLTELGGSGGKTGEPYGRLLAGFYGVPVGEAVEFLADLLVDHVTTDVPFEDLIARYDEAGRLPSTGGP